MAQQPAKNNAPRLILIATVLVVLLVVASVAWKWWPWLIGGSGAPKYETPPLSADYLPPDAGGVLRIHLRELQDSKFVKKEFGSALRQFHEDFVAGNMQKSLGVDPTQDIDWMQIILNAGDLDHPLLMLSGKFDPAKFTPSPDGLREIHKPGDRYRLYELSDPQLGTKFTLAPGDHLLLICDKPKRVTDVLEDAAEGRMPVLEDARLADILKKVDRKQTIWGAASLKKLAKIPTLNNVFMEKYLRPIFNDADAVYGGIACGDAVEGKVYFLTDSEEKAVSVEKAVSDLCDRMKGASLFATVLGLPDDVRPLLKLLAAGKASREEKTVILRCQLPEKGR